MRTGYLLLLIVHSCSQEASMTYFVGKSVSGIFSIFMVVLMVLAGLSACTQSATSTNQSHNAIVIGASLPLSGDRASDGQELIKGYQLWQEAVNKKGGLLGRPVKLDIVNYNSDSKQVVTDYQKLITLDKVDLIFAPFSSVLTVAGAPIAHRYGYAYISGTGGIDKLYDFGYPETFNVSLPIRSYLDTFSQYILSLSQSQRPKTV